MKPTSLTRKIGTKVREKRTAKGITQKQLAAQCGVSERLIRSLEMGTAYGIGLEKLIDIISSLGLDLTLVDQDNNTNNKDSSSISQGSEYSSALHHARSHWHVMDINEGA